MDLYDEEYFLRTHKRALSSPSYEEWDELIKLVGKKNTKLKVLDAGCGTGEAIRYLSGKTSWDIIGVDFSEHAKKYWGGIKCYIGDVCGLEFPDKSFDVVFSSHTFAHFYSPEGFLEESFRILRKMGKLVIITPNIYYIYMMRPLNILGIIKYKPDPTVLSYYSLNSLTMLLKKYGFIVRQAYHYGEIASLLKIFSRIKFVDRFRSRLIICAEKK